MPDSTNEMDRAGITANESSTLPAVFDSATKNFASSVAMKSRYSWGYRSITYEELDVLISSLGTGLIASGLEKGDRVALIAENSPEWTIVYAAVTSCGAIVVPLDTQFNVNEIRHLILHSNVAFLVTSPKVFSEKIEGMNLEGIHVMIIGEDEPKEGATTIGDVMEIGKEWINNGDRSLFERKTGIDPDDVAAICYTSGTTGQPKGAVLLHRNIASNVEAARERIPLGRSDVFLCLLPLYHTFATTCTFLAPLASGSTMFFARSMKSRDIKEDIVREGVTVFVGVPLLFDHTAAALRRKLGEASGMKRFLFHAMTAVAAGLGRILKKNVARTVFKKQLAAGGFGSIRFFVSGAAALRSDTEDTLNAIGLPVLQGYGQTEASPVISVNPLGKAKRGTVGPPLVGIEATLDSPNEEGIGEIIIKGPNVMKGYYKNEDATRETVVNGWLYTGDLGRIDQDGYISLVGRKKSMIVTAGGKNVYPDEIETLLDESPYILESVILAVKDKKGNDRVAAVIVPDYDTLGSSETLKGRLTEEGIRSTITEEVKRVCAGLPEYKRVVDFQIRDEELPKTTTRKIKRHLVKWIDE